MDIAPGGFDGSMAERVVHESQVCAAGYCVAAVGVPEPVRAHTRPGNHLPGSLAALDRIGIDLDARPHGGGLYDPVDLALVEATGGIFARAWASSK
jgi:hypothetical protein